MGRILDEREKLSLGEEEGGVTENLASKVRLAEFRKTATGMREREEGEGSSAESAICFFTPGQL